MAHGSVAATISRTASASSRASAWGDGGAPPRSLSRAVRRFRAMASRDAPLHSVLYRAWTKTLVSAISVPVRFRSTSCTHATKTPT